MSGIPMLEDPAMARKKSGKPEPVRFELRVDEEWLSRVAAMAKRFGLSAAAYIRLAVTRQLEQDERTASEE